MNESQKSQLTCFRLNILFHVEVCHIMDVLYFFVDHSSYGYTGLLKHMLQSVLLLNVCKLVSEQEIAKQLQEEEEIEMRRQRAATGYNNNDCVSPLCDGNYYYYFFFANA